MNERKKERGEARKEGRGEILRHFQGNRLLHDFHFLGPFAKPRVLRK